MTVRILFFIASITWVYGCSQKPSIVALCEKDSKGNYLLKWEIYPEMDNIPVEIYMSDNDSVFPDSPLLRVNSNDYIAVIDSTSTVSEGRKFFRLKIEGAYSDIISNRFFELDSIQNFRDLGGYKTNDNLHIRWGKIYRSGSLSRMTSKDSLQLGRLGIKTIIDIRSEDVNKQHLNRYKDANNIRIPIACDGYNYLTQRISDGNFRRGDAVIFTQDIYKSMIEDYAEAYARMFDYLCNENNYPILYHCYLGKDQTGLASYFLLRALDIPIDIIEDDYLISENGIDRSKLINGVDSLSESSQEAWTMLTKIDVSYLKYGISCIREKSGSVDDYMLKELKITPEKRQKLKKILLH